jgi:GNAT superfamily N-acetyltransferase
MFLRDISLEDSYKILSDVEPDIPESEFFVKYKKLLKGDVKVLGLFSDTELCTVAVASIIDDNIDGRYLYLYDLVTDIEKRRQGYGTEMLKYVQNLAIYNGCQRIKLNSGLHRSDEHRFLKSNGFEMFHYSFVKELKRDG